MPFITLGRSETSGDYPWIDLDFDGVARQAVAELYALGHRRIAIAAPRRDVNLAFIFLDGYRTAMADHGLPVDESMIIRASSSENGGMQVAQDLLAMDQRPTAVILGHELMSIGLYNELQKAGLQPGRDLSVIAFRNNPQLRFLNPQLACFALSIKDLGTAVGRAVLDLVQPGSKANGLPSDLENGLPAKRKRSASAQTIDLEYH